MIVWIILGVVVYALIFIAIMSIMRAASLADAAMKKQWELECPKPYPSVLKTDRHSDTLDTLDTLELAVHS